MRAATESVGTQTSIAIDEASQFQRIEQQQSVGIPSYPRVDQSIQIEQPNPALPQLQQVSDSQSSQQQIRDQQGNRGQDCIASTSSTMKVFVIVATFFMGLFDLVAYLLGGIKRFIPQSITKLFDRKCSRHHPNDICMDCSSCQQMIQLPGRRFTENECSICYNPIKNKVFYSCQHSCCAECTINYWESGNCKKIRCMYCRKNIDMIYRDFKAGGDKKRIELRQKIRTYNATFAPKDRSLLSKIKECPFLLHRTINFIFTREGVMYMLGHMCSSHFFIVGLLYIISPLDLLPECIFGIFGLLDDIVVMGILFVLLTNFYYRYLLRQDQENSSNDSI